METNNYFNQEHQKGLFTFYKQQQQFQQHLPLKSTQGKTQRSDKQKLKDYLSKQTVSQVKNNPKNHQDQAKSKIKVKKGIHNKKRKSKKQNVKTEEIQKLTTIIQQPEPFETIGMANQNATKKFLLHIVQRNISNMSYQTKTEQSHANQLSKSTAKQQIQSALRNKQTKYHDYLQNSCQSIITKKLGEHKQSTVQSSNKVLFKFFQIHSDNKKPSNRYSKKQKQCGIRSVTQSVRTQPSVYLIDQNSISQNISPSKCQIKLPSIHRLEKKTKKSNSTQLKNKLKGQNQQTQLQIQKNQKFRKANSSKIIKNFHEQYYQKSNLQNSRSKISTINITENCIFRKSSFGWFQKKKQLLKRWGIKL